jgi:hypothetical protein
VPEAKSHTRTLRCQILLSEVTATFGKGKIFVPLQSAKKLHSFTSCHPKCEHQQAAILVQTAKASTSAESPAASQWQCSTHPRVFSSSLTEYTWLPSSDTFKKIKLITYQKSFLKSSCLLTLLLKNLLVIFKIRVECS